MIKVWFTDAEGNCHAHLFASDDYDFAHMIFELRKFDSTDVELIDYRNAEAA